MSEKLERTARILSSADKFYDFFKYRFTDVVNIFPAGFTSAEVVEGVEGSVGAVLAFTFLAGVITEKVKIRTEVVNDAERSLTYKALEGNLFILYKNYQFTLTVSEGSVKWTIEYERVSPLVPPPEIYMALAFATTLAVDAYLLLLNK